MTSHIMSMMSTYGHLIFDKGERIYNGKKIASLTSGAGKIGQPLVKERN